MNNLKKTINAYEMKQQVNIEFIAEKLNLLVNNFKISTKALSEATGISIAAINNLKRGEGNPTVGTLSALANFFGVPLIELLGLDIKSNENKESIVVSLYDLRYADRRDENTLLNKILIEKPKNVDLTSIFGVVLSNNCLSPLYDKGTVFIISENQPFLSGDIVLAQIQTENNTLKRYFVKNTKVYLKNINIDDLIESYDFSEVKVLGVVIQIIQSTVS